MTTAELRLFPCRQWTSTRPPASCARRMKSALSTEVLYRLRILGKLRLLPAMYGRDITAAMTQRYTGDATILPRLGGPTALMRLVQNPTEAMMRMYKAGKEAQGMEEEEQAKAAPAEKPGSVEAEQIAAKRLERIAKEKEERDPHMVQLNELIQLAQQHDLPGVDANSISVRLHFGLVGVQIGFISDQRALNMVGDKEEHI